MIDGARPELLLHCAKVDIFGESEPAITNAHFGLASLSNGRLYVAQYMWLSIPVFRRT